MAKGGTEENLIGRELSELWTEGKRKDLVRRTESSGGRLTSTRQRNNKAEVTKYQGGDLTFSDTIIKPLFDLFSIESKTGYADKKKCKKCGEIYFFHWCILDVLDSAQDETKFETFWKQASRDAQVTNRFPMLIFRRNRRKSCIALRTSEFGEFLDQFGNPVKRPYFKMSIGNEEITIMQWRDFQNWTKGGFRSFIESWLSRRVQIIRRQK